MLCCYVNQFNPRREVAVSLLYKDRITLIGFSWRLTGSAEGETVQRAMKGSPASTSLYECSTLFLLSRR